LVTVQDPEPTAVLRLQILCQSARPVRRVVIDDKKIRRGKALKHGRNEPRQVFLFIISRDDDKYGQGFPFI
jgi:hypothetical protein